MTDTATARHTRVMAAAMALLLHQFGPEALVWAGTCPRELEYCVRFAYALEAAVEAGIPAPSTPVEGKF